ncbi:MAG: murein L,D-transpeptidase family protein [Pseudomonadota bacterium]
MLRFAVTEADPIFMRIFKEESELEVWKRGPTGQYLLLESYEICTWSGQLGPKFQEGDRQAPEGFYTVTPALMNPNSSFYLSFNLGFPNSYDRSHGRTGSHLMVHGACSSAGCYAMTDEQISDIYGLAREAFEGGQRGFQVHAFPFRMTPENMARYANHEHFPFWQMLQEGYQHFELTRLPPQVDVCDRRYIFNAEAAGQFSAAQECPDYRMPPQLELAFNNAQREYQTAFEVALAEFQPEGFTVPAAAGSQPVLIADTPAAPATLTTPVQPAIAQPTVAVAPAPVPAPTAAPAPVAPPIAPPATLEAVAPAVPAPTLVEAAPVVPEPVSIETVVVEAPAVPAAVEAVVPVEAASPVEVQTVAAEPAAESTLRGGFSARAGSLFD